MDDFPVEALQMPSYDPDDPDQEEAAQEAAELRKTEEAETVRRLLSTYEGRTFFWMSMAQSGMDYNPFSGEETHSTAFRCGKHSNGEWIKNWVFTVAPQAYSIMRREAIQREHRYADAVGMSKKE